MAEDSRRQGLFSGGADTPRMLLGRMAFLGGTVEMCSRAAGWTRTKASRSMTTETPVPPENALSCVRRPSMAAIGARAPSCCAQIGVRLSRVAGKLRLGDMACRCAPWPAVRHGGPRSTMRPRSMTQISSACATVDSRWAITRVVRPSHSVRSAFWIACSDSRIERRGRFVEQDDRRVLEKGAGDGDALALAAGKLHAVLAAGRVVAACSKPMMKSCAYAAFAAATISSSLAPGRPMAILSRTEPLNRKFSCAT